MLLFLFPTPILNLQPICINWSQSATLVLKLFILFHLAPIVKLHYNRQLLTTALTELEHCLQGWFHGGASNCVMAGNAGWECFLPSPTPLHNLWKVTRFQ